MGRQSQLAEKFEHSLQQAVAAPEELLAMALEKYEKSCNPKIKSEHCAQHRLHAKEIATVLLAVKTDPITKQFISSQALNILGRIALDEGFYTQAEDYIDQALKVAPRNPGLWFSRGHIHLAKHELTQACETFEMSLKLGPDETRAASSLAYTKAKQGRLEEAFQDYRKLIKKHPEDEHIISKLFEITETLEANNFDPELEKDVKFYLSLNGANYSSLTKLISSLLRYKYNMGTSGFELIMDDICLDEFLIDAISKINFNSAELELFVGAIRKQTLLISLTKGDIPNNLVSLISALSINASITEYVLFIDEEEQQLLDELKGLISLVTQDPNWKPADICGAVLLYSMYLPVSYLPDQGAMTEFPINRWPNYARKAIKHALYEFEEEKQIAKTIESIGKIKDEVSKKVQQQYEDNPYPRWINLAYNTPTNYGRAIEQTFPGFRAPAFFNTGEIEVLVAGAGTGRHALHVARYFRNVKVTAIDLSKRSLAYAKRMADKYCIRNIEFYQADILNLEQLDKKFHIIECSGVLHHMRDPEAGWKSLSQLLLPNGLMKIALYSKQARRIIQLSRDIISRNRLTSSPQDIRKFRMAIMSSQHNSAFNGILESPDFYNTSGCRDLIFHVQESQFSPLQLEKLIDKMGMEFIGFLLNRTQTQQHFEMFGDRDMVKDLKSWEVFEHQYPESFSGMYQFYCQKA